MGSLPKPPVACRLIHTPATCVFYYCTPPIRPGLTAMPSQPLSAHPFFFRQPSPLVTSIAKCPARVGSYSSWAGLIRRLHSWLPSSKSFYGAQDYYRPHVSSLLICISRAHGIAPSPGWSCFLHPECMISQFHILVGCGGRRENRKHVSQVTEEAHARTIKARSLQPDPRQSFHRCLSTLEFDVV
jgi:hypothetical protein